MIGSHSHLIVASSQAIQEIDESEGMDVVFLQQLGLCSDFPTNNHELFSSGQSLKLKYVEIDKVYLTDDIINLVAIVLKQLTVSLRVQLITSINKIGLLVFCVFHEGTHSNLT